MRKEINSPAIRIAKPETPIVHIDHKCVAFDGNLKDQLGNTYSCNESIEFWSTGISNATIQINSNPISLDNCSVNFQVTTNAFNTIKRPLILGNLSENGFWLEITENSYQFKSNSGALFTHAFENYFTLGITKANSSFRFFHNGLFSSELTLNSHSENYSRIEILKEDKFDHFLIYDRTLTDSQMKDLYSLSIVRSNGLDHFGFMNSVQFFDIG